MLTCLLLGAVLGQRFKVLVLIPGMVVVLPVVATAGIVRADPYAQIAIALMVAGVSPQLGCLAGLALRHLKVPAPGVSNKRVFPIPKDVGTQSSPIV
jgi:hypothetical protein